MEDIGRNKAVFDKRDINLLKNHPLHRVAKHLVFSKTASTNLFTTVFRRVPIVFMHGLHHEIENTDTTHVGSLAGGTGKGLMLYLPARIVKALGWQVRTRVLIERHDDTLTVTFVDTPGITTPYQITREEVRLRKIWEEHELAEGQRFLASDAGERWLSARNEVKDGPLETSELSIAVQDWYDGRLS